MSIHLDLLRLNGEISSQFGSIQAFLETHSLHAYFGKARASDFEQGSMELIGQNDLTWDMVSYVGHQVGSL